MATKESALAAARSTVGLTQENLAFALDVSVSTLSRWENGLTKPLPSKRPKLAKLLHVSVVELDQLLTRDRKNASDVVLVAASPTGAAPLEPLSIGPATSPRFPHTLDDALRGLEAIARVDDGADMMPGARAFEGRLPAQAVRAWRLRGENIDIPTAGVPTSVRDIAEITATTTALDRLDRQFGGDYSRGLAVKYLTSRVLPILRRPASDSVRRELFQASAVLSEVIGYMAYDSQLHRLAQHYLILSLRLAKQAGNPAYGSFVLATMSHQALYLDRPDQALTLALAAQETASSASIAAVKTEAAMLEAAACATLGDQGSSTEALRRAEKSYDQHGPADETPYWMAHWDDAVFASFASSAWLELGNVRAAEPYLQTLWDNAHGQVRRQVFAAGQQAKAALLEHDVERCARYGTIAAEAAAAANSKRSHHIVRDLLSQLEGRRQLRPVRELTETVATLLPSEAP
ncbi:multiprotein-bridging factor 1 family protein [Amycolatopsis sp. NPDC052450]|uniref:multiprotein-bridging factor 1 family protein n=1 Tax=Amycolatopsis sp. NPDC052450 TaxID=3363937 RepID=UPI0037C83976